MKKILFGIIILLNINVSAQFAGVDLSLEPNLSWFRFKETDTPIEYGSRIGGSIKAPIAYSFLNYFEIESRPGISYYGARQRSEIISNKYHFIYASTPLYLKILPQKEAAFYLGLNLEYQLTARLDDMFGTSITEDYDNKFNYGLSGGISYHFQNGMKFFIFYTHGLSSLIKDLKIIDEYGDPAGDDKLFLRTFSLGLSYRICCKSKDNN